MSETAIGEFSISALYAALDDARREHSLSWQAVAREINSQFAGLPARQISASTISGMRGRRVVEGDGVLQMLLWLDRTPESFAGGDATGADEARLPRVGADRILRFDAKAIHAALDEQRIARGLAWHEVAAEIGGLSASGLTRLAKGGRTGFPEVMRIMRWLGRPAAEFTRASDW